MANSNADPSRRDGGSIELLRCIRDDFARILHDGAHGKVRHSCDGGWKVWRVDADAFMPTVRSWMAEVWDEGFQASCDETPISHTPAGPLDGNNPYRGRHPDTCFCAFCYSAAMGGGR